MKHDERIEIIIREVQEKGQVKVPELAQMLDCSEVTMRNDIRKLDDQGILKKTHGGAEKRSYGLSVQFESGEYYLNADYKRRITEKAYEYIEDQESIMIDDSTTCCYLAQIIKERKEKRLSVVTNSIYVAAELSGAGNVSVHVLGGQISSNPASVMGNITANAIRQYHVNKLFSGINAIDFQIGLTAADAMHAEVKRVMMEQANQTYILADHTKMGRGGLFTVCPIEEVERIITDSKLSKEMIYQAEKKGIKLDTV